MTQAEPPREMVLIKDLVKQFGPLRAVNGVNLSVPQGQVTVIIGPSGSGKSTVLRCVNHLETPTKRDHLHGPRQDRRAGQPGRLLSQPA